MIAPPAGHTARMRILILGGTGNISSAVVADLVARHHAVTITTRGKRPVPAGVETVVAERHDATALAAATPGTWDAVIDFLCFTPEHAAEAHAAFAGRCGQYLFISSATVYAKPHQVPVVESDPLGNSESAYAQAKQATESWLLERHQALPVTVVRPSHTFGHTWIPSPFSGCDFTVCQRILAGKPVILHDQGRSLWALTPADDFAAALAGLLGNPEALGTCVHITSDEVLSWNGIYHELGLLLGAKPRIVHVPSDTIARVLPETREKLHGDKMHHGCFDNTRIKTLVPDWQCRWRLRDALRRSIDHHRARAEGPLLSAAADAAIERVLEAHHG